MSADNNVRNENTPEENENISWPTFDYNHQNWPANRLYVSELPENATPGIRQQRDDSQELFLKFDWYFSTSESEIQSREFTVPKSGKKFLFRARSSQWMEHGKHVQVLLLVASDCPDTVGLEFNATLRSPNWKSIEELRGCQMFNYANKSFELFSIKGKPVDVWPVDPTIELTAGMDLVPRVYGIKGKLKYISDRIQNWKLVTRPNTKDTDSMTTKDTDLMPAKDTDLIHFDVQDEN